MAHISEMKVTDAFRSDGISQSLDCSNQRVSHTHSSGLSAGLTAADIWSCDIENMLSQGSPQLRSRSIWLFPSQILRFKQLKYSATTGLTKFQKSRKYLSQSLTKIILVAQCLH
uniref:Putative ovule protein n=1 Tax=Solanum chacoense TaxID=4108 RepID=A0A0V0HGP2_SOLCH